MASDKLSRLKLARVASRLKAQNGRALPALVLMTDDERLPDPLASAAALPPGSLIILRARQASHRAKLAQALRTIARARRLYLSIANDPALAARLQAHGVHLSRTRAHEAAHWRALRPNWLITAASSGLSSQPYADAVLVSPVFETQSHPGRAALGPLRLRKIARESRTAVYALGGINEANVRRLEGANLAGIAAIGALAA